MIKIVRTLAMSFCILALFSTPVMAVSFGDQTAPVYSQPYVTTEDGKEVEYFHRPDGVSTGARHAVRTITPDEVGDTVRYDITIMNDEQTQLITGSYVTINHVVRISALNGSRWLLAKGPVTINIPASYINQRTVNRMPNFTFEDGRMIEYINYMQVTENRVFESYGENKAATFTLSESGLYYLNLGHNLESGFHAYIYVPAEGEDVTYKAPKEEQATAEALNVTVDGKVFKPYGYIINGSNYIKLRDLAYILKDNPKHFNIVDNPVRDAAVIKQSSREMEAIGLQPWKDGSDNYVVKGGELDGVPTVDATAIPSTKELQVNGNELLPAAYNINGQLFVKVKDMADILDLGLVQNDSSGNIVIDTSLSYSKLGIRTARKINIQEKKRLAGKDRYQTAVAISQEGWSHADNVVLASSDDYHDALVGSSFAYLKDAPILITSRDSLNSDTSAEIARLGAKTVYIIGGTKSISSDVENQLKQKYTVVRIGGANTDETAAKVAEEVKGIKPFNTVILATWQDFPDALAMASYSAKDTMPILFSGKPALGYTAQKALEDWGIKNVIIAV